MIKVSDHALLRFLERAAGIDVEAVRADLETCLARPHAMAEALGIRTYAVRSDGHRFIVRSGWITTVVADAGSRSGFDMLAPRIAS